MIKYIKEHSLFFLIFFTCIVLRLLPLFQYQFTLDELSGLYRTQFASFGEMIEKGVKPDAHPALVQILIYYLSKLFGYQTWIIRLPFLLCSFGAVWFAYRFCIRNFTKQAGIFAALLLSFSLVFVFYAPIARMYISGIFFSLALLYYFFEIFYNNNVRAKNYFYLGLFAWLGALNQHMNALFALTVFLLGFLLLKKEHVKNYLLTCLLVIVAYLPHLPVTLAQFSLAGIGYEQGGWLKPPQHRDLWGFLKVLLGTGRSYIVVFGVILLSFVLNRKDLFNKKQLHLLILFLVNYLVIFYYSIFRAPIFQNSVMLFAGTALVLLIASLITFKDKRIFAGAALLVAFTLLYKTYYKKNYYEQCVRATFEYQFERTAELKRQYGDASVYPVFLDADQFMREIYFKKYQTSFDVKISGDSSITSLRNFNELIANLKSDYLVLASSLPHHQAYALEYFPYLIENTQTQGVNLKVYSRKESDKNKVVKDSDVLHYSDVYKPGAFTYENLDASKFENGAFNMRVDSLNEFPFAVRGLLKDVSSKEGQFILLKTKIKPENNSAKGIEACLSMDDKDDKTKNYHYNAGFISDYPLKPDGSVNLYASAYCGTNYPDIKDKAKITAFLWNRGHNNFKVTLFEITTIDYWPEKWNFWE
ncbi:MAG: hypothetical protein K0S12_1986 [Bacteroidetes bacterium]|nr:hypothetical protein [Bacteroidota bacterium]